MPDPEPATETATTFELKDWSELTVKQRRSRKALYEYIQSVLAGDS